MLRSLYRWVCLRRKWISRQSSEGPTDASCGEKRLWYLLLWTSTRVRGSVEKAREVVDLAIQFWHRNVIRFNQATELQGPAEFSKISTPKANNADAITAHAGEMRGGVHLGSIESRVKADRPRSNCGRDPKRSSKERPSSRSGLRFASPLIAHWLLRCLAQHPVRRFFDRPMLTVNTDIRQCSSRRRVPAGAETFDSPTSISGNWRAIRLASLPAKRSAI
jgi:hypothetical protein